MTVCVAVRVPGDGAVVGCDSRVSDSDTGYIFTDQDTKWLQTGSAIVLGAGCFGDLWQSLRASPPRSWSELYPKLVDKNAADNERDAEYLIYDRRKDRLLRCDSVGDVLVLGLSGAVGCGATLALGVIESAKTPESLDEAATLVQKALKLTCRKNAFCGGRIRTIVVPRKGALKEV